MRALAVIPLLALVGSCKPAQTAPPPAPLPRLGPIEVPDDLIAEVLVRDAHTLLETAARASGNPSLDPKNLASAGGPDIAAFLDAVDLKSPAGAALTGDIKASDKWHWGIALKLRDPKGARQTLAAKVQKGELKAEESTAIRAKIYPAGKTAFALIGEAIVLADSRATIEASGRWIAKEGTEGTPPHDVVARVPLARYAVPLRNEIKKTWDEAMQNDGDVAIGQPLMKQLLDIAAGMGDLDLALDLEKEDAVVDAKLAASGMFSQWLAKYPAGPARSILTMPKSSSAFVIRFPDSVSDLFKQVADDAAKKDGKKELEDLRVLARSVGHEVAIATLETKAGKTSEVLFRVELIDPAAAKTAIKTLMTDVAGKPDRKVQRVPWAKAGAEGESLQITDGSDKYDARWAIKGNALYLDVAWQTKATLLDNALEPSKQLGGNPRAKAFADRMPKDGLVFSYYAETAKAPKLEELGAVPALTGVRWGWAGASKDGISSQWNLPLADLGQLFKKEEASAAASSSAAPPPPPPPPKPKS